MSFGLWIITLSTILYIVAGIVFFLYENYGLGIAYLCYAGANIGLALTTLNI